MESLEDQDFPPTLLKTLCVRIKKTKVDPESLLKLRSDVIVISDDDEPSDNHNDASTITNTISNHSLPETNLNLLEAEEMESNNNDQFHSEKLSAEGPQSINIKDCYEFIGIQNLEDQDKEQSPPPTDESSQEEERPSLIFKIKRRKTNICEKLVISPSPPAKSWPGFKSSVRRTKSASPVRLKATKGSAGTTNSKCDFKKERKALLQKLRQQEISSLKKDLRERLPDHLRPETKLEGSSLANSLITFCGQLQSEIDCLQFDFYRAEKQNVLLHKKLADLKADKSCWPYQVTETSQKISIRKLNDDFVF